MFASCDTSTLAAADGARERIAREIDRYRPRARHYRRAGRRRRSRAHTSRVELTSSAHRRRPGVRIARVCDFRGDHLDTATLAMAVGHWCAHSARRIFSELRKLDASLPDGFTLEPARALDLSFWVGSFPGACVARRVRIDRVRRLTLAGTVWLRTRRTSWNAVRRRQIHGHDRAS